MPEHSPEPWTQGFECSVESATDRNREHIFSGSQLVLVTRSPWDSAEKSQANAARIVACVNALAGLNPAGIKELIQAAEEVLSSDYVWDDRKSPKSTDRLRAALEKVRGK